ncbi:hypothetical protein BC831DRAFT_76449 [Entophlyctis helioformis]|nr:hypothetical protein BC831DRAFT_76449 [Entophlyctis helioformis]
MTSTIRTFRPSSTGPGLPTSKTSSSLTTSSKSCDARLSTLARMPLIPTRATRSGDATSRCNGMSMRCRMRSCAFQRSRSATPILALRPRRCLSPEQARIAAMSLPVESWRLRVHDAAVNQTEEPGDEQVSDVDKESDAAADVPGSPEDAVHMEQDRAIQAAMQPIVITSSAGDMCTAEAVSSNADVNHARHDAPGVSCPADKAAGLAVEPREAVSTAAVEAIVILDSDVASTATGRDASATVAATTAKGPQDACGMDGEDDDEDVDSMADPAGRVVLVGPSSCSTPLRPHLAGVGSSLQMRLYSDHCYTMFARASVTPKSQHHSTGMSGDTLPQPPYMSLTSCITIPAMDDSAGATPARRLPSGMHGLTTMSLSSLAPTTRTDGMDDESLDHLGDGSRMDLAVEDNSSSSSGSGMPSHPIKLSYDLSNTSASSHGSPRHHGHGYVR